MLSSVLAAGARLFCQLSYTGSKLQKTKYASWTKWRLKLLADQKVLNENKESVQREVCPFCKLESKNLESLKTHIVNIHGCGKSKNKGEDGATDEIRRQMIETCSECNHCDFIGNDKDMEKHITKKHGSLASCGECGEIFSDVTKCEKHMETTHVKNIEVDPLQCDECNKTFVVFHSLLDHKSKDHSKSEKAEPVPCIQCKMIFGNGQALEEHMTTHEEIRKFTCTFCSYEATSSDTLTSHTLEVHDDPQLLNFISNQLSRVTDSFDLFEVFKVELKDVLNQIIGGHNAVRQELFILRNNQTTNESKLKKIDISLTKLPELIINGSSSSSSEIPSPRTSSKPSPTSTESVPPPGNLKADMSVPPPAGNTTKATKKSPSTKSYPKTSKHQHEPKILFVGDSISAHADVKVIAEATRSKIVTAKAYSAIHDMVSNKAKQAAFYPSKNFLEVVPLEAAKDEFKHIIIQTGSVDITNLRTNENPEQYLEYFKQETIKSAKNIFNSGLCALDRQVSSS